MDRKIFWSSLNKSRSKVLNANRCLRLTSDNFLMKALLLATVLIWKKWRIKLKCIILKTKDQCKKTNTTTTLNIKDNCLVESRAVDLNKNLAEKVAKEPNRQNLKTNSCCKVFLNFWDPCSLMLKSLKKNKGKDSFKTLLTTELSDKFLLFQNRLTKN